MVSYPFSGGQTENSESIQLLKYISLGKLYWCISSTLTRIKPLLGKFGFDMGDIVKMNIYMVGDPSKGNAMDFAGMMTAYRRYFGTQEQPNKPARTTSQVVALTRPGALLEIEVIAAKSHNAPKRQERK